MKLPLPVPAACDVRLNHAALLTAVHWHWDAAVTTTVPVAPLALAMVIVGFSITLQGLTLIVVGSLALAEGEPPPVTATWFVICPAADGPTFTVTVIAG